MNKKSIKRLFSMGLLFFSKTGNVLVGIFFLPLYNRLLGAEQFGLVAIILSFQAFLMMLDFGMSTIVNRDIAASEVTTREALSTIDAAETLLSILYFCLLLLVLIVFIISPREVIDLIDALGVVCLFLSLVLINVSQSALLGCQSYYLASVIQITGVLFRASITLLFLFFLNSDIKVFIFSQLSVSIVHLIFVRYFCRAKIMQRQFSLSDFFPRVNLADVVKLAKRGKPLLFFGIAGASVTQLDKPIISHFMSPSDVVPYFLAGSLCMAPISVLAGPVSQYFQPIVINRFSLLDQDKVIKTVRMFTLFLISATFIPTLFLFIFREEIINLWLGRGNSSIAMVISYTSVLLPGVAIGALGYIPNTLLITAQDFKFQAKLSSILTIITLLCVLFFSINNNIMYVCFSYASYYLLSTTIAWIRALNISQIRMCAIESSKVSLALTLFFIFFLLASTLLIR
ncbi:lipopolysaccharide biosynthesis protein [Dongshaea marina]|uniref:lipopolysaccharide biosynthesis protein n=1 Tax=Dongshaea marina TaxID=2047966 RepID=UPI000D3EDE7A|nr:oligosaccharide flippase family protein [Dongshaea marina]